MRYFRIVSLSSICLLVLTGLIFTNYSVASPLITTTPSHTPVRDQHSYLPLVMKNAADIVVTPTTLNLQFSEQLEWRETQAGSQTQSYDIMIVLDTSDSMRYCWDTLQACVPQYRRIDRILPHVNNFIETMLVTQRIQGYDHRIGLVEFKPSSSASLIQSLTADPNTFASLTGYKNGFFVYPTVELLNYGTPWAQALEKASEPMQTTSIDENGRPRKKAIIFITDGTANVLFDQPYKGVLNGDYPFHCGSSNDRSIDDPLVQSTCPILSTSSNVRSPVRAAIDVADLARNTNRILTHAILLGSPYSISDMKLDQIAPHFAVKAPEPSDIAQIFSDLNVQFQTVQCSVVSETRPAIGANVTIKDASNNLVVQGTTDASGIFTATLSPTTYMVSAEHLNIVAPNDSEAISRTYRLAATAFNPINPPAPFLLTRDPDTPLCP